MTQSPSQAHTSLVRQPKMDRVNDCVMRSGRASSGKISEGLDAILVCWYHRRRGFARLR
jgi:hypothetical protein